MQTTMACIESAPLHSCAAHPFEFYTECHFFCDMDEIRRINCYIASVLETELTSRRDGDTGAIHQYIKHFWKYSSSARDANIVSGYPEQHVDTGSPSVEITSSPPLPRRALGSPPNPPPSPLWHPWPQHDYVRCFALVTVSFKSNGVIY